MKALSLRQPWAYAVLHLGKRIENRTWDTTFRGTFLIHAAKACTAPEYEEFVEFTRGRAIAHPIVPLPEALPRGGIVGRARLAGVVRPDGKNVSWSPHSTLLADAAGLDLRWHIGGNYGFVLADVEPLPFVPWRGAQRWFEVPEEVVGAAGASAGRG